MTTVQAADAAVEAAIRLSQDVGIPDNFGQVRTDSYEKNRMNTGKYEGRGETMDTSDKQIRAIAEAAVLPTLSGRVGGNYSNLDTNAFRTDGYDWGASVGVELGGVIYQGGALNSVFRQSKANRDNSRAALLQTTATVGEQVGRAWAVRESAGAALSATERQIQAAQIAFDGTREEATLGARTTLDVLDAEQDLLNARTSRVNAASQEQIAVYGVLASMGRLTVDYLKLPVTAYDPSVYYNSVRNAPGGVTSSQGIKLDRVLKSIGQY